MATDYPLDLLSEDGSTIRYQLIADFTDPDNQPAQGGALEPPLVVPETGTTVLVTDTPDGDDLLDYDADAVQFNFGAPVEVHGNITAVSGTVDGAALGATFVYVDVQASPPDPIDSFAGPFVFDTTAVTGGLYGWDGSQYQQIGGPL